MTAALPLTGIRVLDLTRALAGPYCTALLGDLGADVIKVESARGGDVTRGWPPFEGEHSLYFDSVNRNKRSVVVDFYSAEGKALLKRLALECDVVVENFKVGVLAELGLDEASLRADRPGIVVASVTAFGATGPLADAAGLDQVAQGMSGLMSVTGPDSEHPYRFGVPIIDLTSGVLCALGIVAALVGRARTGAGAGVTTSLLETALALSAFQGQQYLSTGTVPEPQGNDHPTITPYGVFATADTPIIVAVANEKQWVAFCALLGDPDLAFDARFVSGRLRTQHRAELLPLLGALLAGRPAEDWIAEIRAAGIPCGPISTYAQAFAEPQVRAVGMVQQTRRHDGSPLPLVRGPLSIDGRPTAVRSAPPALGADTDAVLRELGLDVAPVLPAR